MQKGEALEMFFVSSDLFAVCDQKSRAVNPKIHVVSKHSHCLFGCQMLKVCLISHLFSSCTVHIMAFLFQETWR